MLYILLYFIFASLAIVEPKVNKTQRPFLVAVVMLIMVLFQGLRWRTGTDWDSYYNFFIASYDWDNCLSYGFEIGFSILNYAIRNLTDSYTVLLIVEALITCTFVCLSARYFTCNNRVLILLIVFACFVFPIRQVIAVSIIMYSYKYVAQRKLFKFLICLLLAFSIHRSALVFLPAYFIVNKQWSGTVIFIVYFASLLLGFATEKIFGGILNAVLGTYYLFSDTVQSKLNYYISPEVPEYAEMSFPRIALSVVNSLLLLVFLYVFKEKKYKDNAAYNMLFNLHWVGICINRLVWLAIPDFARATNFYGMSDVFLFVLAVNSVKKNKQFWMLLLLAYYFAKYYMVVFGNFSDLFVPYYSIFSNSQRVEVY